MKHTRLIMGMPITVEIIDDMATPADLEDIFSYFSQVDETFSTYKKNSEITMVNNGLPEEQWSNEMRMVLELCEQTKGETDGYFDIEHGGKRDPSGLVKGWAIQNAADKLAKKGFRNYYIDAGGDIQASGLSGSGENWSVGIRNPFNRDEIIKTLTISTEGIATSGNYIRGQHIYDPHNPAKPADDVVSITVVGPDVYNADRLATAAYAMGRRGAAFIESLPGYEAYVVGKNQRATLTSGFERYIAA